MLAGWSFRRKLTIPASAFSTTETDFPIPVILDNTTFTFANAKADGADVRFTSSDGVTLLKFEREQHDNILEKAVYHVKVPSVSNAVDTDIFIYYGNASAPDTEDPVNTWDSNFQAVYHMTNLTGTTIKDSTGNGHTGTKGGTIGTPIEIDSSVYKGQDFERDNNQQISCGTGVEFTTNNFTIEALTNVESVATGGFNSNFITGKYDSIGNNEDSNSSLGINNASNPFFLIANATTFEQVTLATTVTVGQHFFAGRGDGSNLKIWFNTLTNQIVQTVTPVSNTHQRDIGQAGDFNGTSSPFDGVIDEIRFSTVSRSDSWISATRLGLLNTLLTYGAEQSTYTVAENITLTDSILYSPSNHNYPVNENIILSDNIVYTPSNIDYPVNENIILSDNVGHVPIQVVDNIVKVTNSSPLYAVTDTSPAKLAVIDITTPTTPVISVFTLIGVNNARDISLDPIKNELHIACADGKVVKADIANLTLQTIIDLSDVDNLETIDSVHTSGLILTGTVNPIGELYLIDERLTQQMDARLDVLTTFGVPLEADFRTIQTSIMNSSFHVLSDQTVVMDSSFVCLTNVINSITPLNRNDITVFLDGVQLNDFDVDLSTVTILHNVKEKSQATFRLNRKHDNFDNDLNNNTKQISNNNGIRIFINNILEFDGNVSNIDCKYNNDSEFVVITADSINEGEFSFVTKNLSLPSLDKSLGLYEVLIEEPNIFNPVVGSEELNPKKHKGIFVNLGVNRNQTTKRFHFFDSFGSIADSIQDSTFNPKQNAQYFWGSVSVNKPEFFGQSNSIFGSSSSPFQFPNSAQGIGNSVFNFPTTQVTGRTSAFTFLYIGTNLSPVSEDLWQLVQANYRLQRILPDTVQRIGDGKLFQVQIQEVLPTEDFAGIFSDLQTGGYLVGNDLTNLAKNIKVATDIKINRSITIKNIVFSLIDQAFGYYIGLPPFRTISVNSGEFHPDWRWEDQNDGLYSVLDEHYNYTNYAKSVADLELKLLQNINGNILPDTDCTIEMTIDAYQFFQLKLLNKINVDNTTQTGIFSSANGFPVSIKSISLNVSNMKVILRTDNSLSQIEQEKIRGNFPDSDEFIVPKSTILIAPKTDMRTKLRTD